MRKYWRQIKVSEIKSIGGVGGRFGEAFDIYFTVTLKNGDKHSFHYDSKKAYEERDKLYDLFIEVNQIPESYLLENEAHIEVDGKPISFGCRVENNKGNYEYKTLLEIEELNRQGKIRDEGWRHLAYVSLLSIVNGELVRGKLTPACVKQLKHLKIDF